MITPAGVCMPLNHKLFFFFPSLSPDKIQTAKPTDKVLILEAQKTETVLEESISEDQYPKASF